MTPLFSETRKIPPVSYIMFMRGSLFLPSGGLAAIQQTGCFAVILLNCLVCHLQCCCYRTTLYALKCLDLKILIIARNGLFYPLYMAVISQVYKSYSIADECVKRSQVDAIFIANICPEIWKVLFTETKSVGCVIMARFAMCSRSRKVMGKYMK